MTQTENEKELILGNKQLITLFFLVVAMCGAFFAFGYIIGRNGGKTTLASNAVENGAPATTSPAAPADTSAAAPPAPALDSAPVTETQPARDVPSTTTPFSSQTPPPVAPSTPTPAPVAAPAATVTAKPSASPLTPVPAAAAPVASSALDPSGTYLQVTALRKADADNLVKTLRELNFPAFTAESSKSDLFRVLVGPYRQMGQVADAKARLKSLGFANAFVQK